MTMNGQPGVRYSGVAMLLHWAIAIAVIVNWRLAEAAHEGPREAGASLMATHKALGMTILALTLLRLAWRLVHKTPPLSARLKGWERMLARVTHVTFYVLLIALPLGGWIASSLNGRPVDFFGLFAIPVLPTGLDKDLGKTIFEAHHTGGSIMIYLIALHVIGALKHTFWDKDGNLWRMLPFGTPRA
ncbi:cytochrome b [Tsuneonella sp. YG55]|uniref:Cytochrome b n=1 Tax=Tsuneonella litorea TaxID=2976475 RepID=A0A9X2W550_9SPHN|nr:cytochrome b [Tsuneonella litorea]MCT2559811.1 cytochrome b [Tsuneonella litorea]